MKSVSRAVGNRRLLKLAAFLRKLPRKRFDYCTWTGDNWKGAQDLSCGTTACALGWAATMPTFRRLGLYLNVYGTPELPGARGREWWESPAIVAASRLFSITTNQAGMLFAPDEDEEDATPKYVARKIERFVKEHP